MRTYVRLPYPPAPGPRKWYIVTTDATGSNDAVWFVTLINNILLFLLESPFYGQNGAPYQQSVIQQVAPDYYVQLTQQRFAPYFIALTITRVPNTIDPTYKVRAVFHNGSQIVTQLTLKPVQ